MNINRKTLIARLIIFAVIIIAGLFYFCKPVDSEVYISIKNLSEIMHDTSIELESMAAEYDEMKFKEICSTIYDDFEQDVKWLDDCSQENGIAFLVYRNYELDEFRWFLMTLTEISKEENSYEMDSEEIKTCFTTLCEICDMWENIDWSEFDQRDIRSHEIKELLAETNRLSLVHEEM